MLNLMKRLYFMYGISRSYSPHIQNFYDKGKVEKIFNSLKNPDTNLIIMPKFINELDSLGLKEDDPRLTTMLNDIDLFKKKDVNAYYRGVDLQQFKEFIKSNEELVLRAFEQLLVIPNWMEFREKIEEIFEKCKTNDEGEVATYIPQLGQVSPHKWGASVCTVDGQRFSFGNYQEYFTIQSVAKPFVYALAMDHLGKRTVHKYVGKEPSGRMFNELILNFENKPHNPMINAGAIVVCSLIHSMVDSFSRKPSLVFQNTKNYFDKLAGGLNVGFNTSVYISEQEAADRNYAIAFYLKEHKCFPPKSNLADTLKLYFRCCSLDVTTRILAMMGATLANSGVHPLTSDRIFQADSIRNTLSLMYSCGMYDFSGEFAFEVGIPAKSGVSGAMVISIPDLMGIGLWSPRLGRLGNSRRGIQFCRELVKSFPFHQYDNQLVYPDQADRRKVISLFDQTNLNTFEVLSAAAKGRLEKLKKFFLYGIDLDLADYDGRTALHLAAVEGQLACVAFLLEHAKVKIDPVDRWGQTPMKAAEEKGQKLIVEFLKTFSASEVKSDEPKMKSNSAEAENETTMDEAKTDFHKINREKDTSIPSDEPKN